MRHIVLITTSYLVANDGSEAAGSFVVDLAYALAEKERVTVVAPGLKTELERTGANLVIQRFYAPRQPLSLLKAYNPLHWVAILKTLNNGNAIVRQVIEKNDIDHILALWVLPSGYWARSLAKRHHIPYSTWALGSDIWTLSKIPIVKNILKKVLMDSHINFADGFQLRDDVAALSGRPCDFLPSTRRLHIPRKKRLSEGPPYRLAFLGRWHRNKGVDLLLDSLMLLDESTWLCIEELQICGGGPMADQVKTGIATLKKLNRPVIGQGYLNKDEAIKLLLWADYVLIPSRIESIPVIFSDAMKCSCPVVCMPVGDLPRLVQKYKVGILAKKLTKESFANAIIQTLKHSPQRSAIGLEYASHDFNLEHIVETLLRQLVDNEH